MAFLKKADRGYVPGKLDGPLAGYFTSAHVLEDGSPSSRKFCFPARQHAYFINTFLLYQPLLRGGRMAPARPRPGRLESCPLHPRRCPLRQHSLVGLHRRQARRLPGQGLPRTRQGRLSRHRLPQPLRRHQRRQIPQRRQSHRQNPRRAPGRRRLVALPRAAAGRRRSPAVRRRAGLLRRILRTHPPSRQRPRLAESPRPAPSS